MAYEIKNYSVSRNIVGEAYCEEFNELAVRAMSNPELIEEGEVRRLNGHLLRISLDLTKNPGKASSAELEAFRTLERDIRSQYQ